MSGGNSDSFNTTGAETSAATGFLSLPFSGFQQPGRTTFGKLSDPLNFWGVEKKMSGGGVSNDFSVSNMLAPIVQQQWENYKKIDQPLENQLIKSSTSSQFISDAQKRGLQTADTAFDQAQHGLQMDQQRMGLAPTEEQKGAQMRQAAQQKGLAEAGTANMAGRQAYDTQTAALTGGAPTGINQLVQGISQNT